MLNEKLVARTGEDVAHVLCKLVHEARLHLPVHLLPPLLEHFGRAHPDRLLFICKYRKLSHLILLLVCPDSCLDFASLHTLTELLIRLVNVYYLCGVGVPPDLLLGFNLKRVILIQILHSMLFEGQGL